MTNIPLRALFLLCDLILVMLAGILVWLPLTGGGSLEYHGMMLSIRSMQNPFLFFVSILALRWAAGRKYPFLCVRQWSVANGPEGLRMFCARIHARLASIDASSARRVALALIGLSAAIKLANIIFHFGFYCGDDFEINAMSLGRILGVHEPIWELRNAIYPMLFVYPVQAVTHAFGVVDPTLLVGVGRSVGVVFSSLACWWTYRIASEEFGARGAGIAALALLAFSGWHVCFGGSEEPRSVSAFFLLVTYDILRRNPHHNPASIFAGFALALAAVLRFSEAVFLPPFVLFLLVERRYRDAAVFTIAAVIAAGAGLAISDQLFWGEPFFSVRHIVSFTLFKGLSTRGYQPAYYYLAVQTWTTVFLAALFLYSARLRRWNLMQLAIFPIVILSLLPHKEARYMIPVLPFVAMLAGAGAWHLLRLTSVPSRGDSGSRLTGIPAACALLVLLGGFFLFESMRFEFHRAESGIDVSYYLREHGHAGKVGMSTIWTSGGMLMLPPCNPAQDITLGRLLDARDSSGAPLVGTLEYIALRAGAVTALGIGPILLQRGYREIALRDRHDPRWQYRLFERIRNRASSH
jgi:hypothetical protein